MSLEVTQENLGVYKIRKLSNGEQVIHVPSTLCGHYILYLGSTGVLSFVPIKEENHNLPEVGKAGEVITGS
jgi:hypothetical protein